MGGAGGCVGGAFCATGSTGAAGVVMALVVLHHPYLFIYYTKLII